MHGVLKPVSQSRDAYSQVAPIQGNHSYYCAQYAHPSQTQQPQQSNSWNSSLDSSYCPYGTPSAQQGSNDAYATPGQPASAAQTVQYSGYDPSSNSYTYPEPTQLTPYTHVIDLPLSRTRFRLPGSPSIKVRNLPFVSQPCRVVTEDPLNSMYYNPRQSSDAYATC